MKITLTNTNKIVSLVTPTGEVPARIWEGTTEGGIAIHAYITRIGVHEALDHSQFERELDSCEAPRATAEIEAIPLRLIL